jgi:hypothetical protein
MKQEFSTPSRRVARAHQVPRSLTNPSNDVGAAPLAFITPKTSRLTAPKIVTPRPPPTDARSVERLRLIDAHLAAQGRVAVTRATEALLGAEFAIPDTQAHHLQILEHADEARARDAIDALAGLLLRESPRRLPLLEQRLRRLAEYAEEPSTRAAAISLVRTLHS